MLYCIVVACYRMANALVLGNPANSVLASPHSSGVPNQLPYTRGVSVV
jgi:hypothetical protein